MRTLDQDADNAAASRKSQTDHAHRRALASRGGRRRDAVLLAHGALLRRSWRTFRNMTRSSAPSSTTNGRFPALGRIVSMTRFRRVTDQRFVPM
jgi:hypothetical protein